jgi:hypothetical protein
MRSVWPNYLAFTLFAGITAVPANSEEVEAPLRATHPMDALTPDEIRSSVDILRTAGKFGPTVKLVSLTLEEKASAFRFTHEQVPQGDWASYRTGHVPTHEQGSIPAMCPASSHLVSVMCRHVNTSNGRATRPSTRSCIGPTSYRSWLAPDPIAKLREGAF